MTVSVNTQWIVLSYVQCGYVQRSGMWLVIDWQSGIWLVCDCCKCFEEQTVLKSQILCILIYVHVKCLFVCSLFVSNISARPFKNWFPFSGSNKCAVLNYSGRCLRNLLNYSGRCLRNLWFMVCRSKDMGILGFYLKIDNANKHIHKTQR